MLDTTKLLGRIINKITKDKNRKNVHLVDCNNANNDYIFVLSISFVANLI